MTDLDLLTGAIAARLRAMPAVERLYPPQGRFAAGAAREGDLLTALAADDAVVTEVRDGVLVVEVTLAVGGRRPAPETARAVADAVRAELDAGGVHRRRVAVRIASVER